MSRGYIKVSVGPGLNLRPSQIGIFEYLKEAIKNGRKKTG